MNGLIIVTFALLWIVVIGLAVSVLALSRQIGVLLERVAPAGALMTNKGLAPGELAPELTVGDSTGSPVRIGGKRSDARSTLVFFLSPSCPMCKAVLPAVRATARRESAWLDVVLASDGDDEDHAGLIRREKITDLPYVVSQELGMGFRVGQIPHAALVGDDGRIIAAGLTNTREHVESLVEAKREGVGSLNEYMMKKATNSTDENRVRGFSTVVALVLVLGVALLGLTFYATRGPTDSPAASGTESMPEPGSDGLEDSTEIAVGVVRKPSPQEIPPDPEKSRVSNRQPEGVSPLNRPGRVSERVKKTPEQRRADREARRARERGPSTAAQAIGLLTSAEDAEAQWPGEGWIPPGPGVLSELSPELRESLGLDSFEGDGPAPQLNPGLDTRLVVVDYTIGSPGKRAGIEVGDEIVTYFGEPVRSVRQLGALKALAESLGTRRVAVQVKRSDGIHDLEIRPGRMGLILNGE